MRFVIFTFFAFAIAFFNSDLLAQANAKDIFSEAEKTFTLGQICEGKTPTGENVKLADTKVTVSLDGGPAKETTADQVVKAAAGTSPKAIETFEKNAQFRADLATNYAGSITVKARTDTAAGIGPDAGKKEYPGVNVTLGRSIFDGAKSEAELENILDKELRKLSKEQAEALGYEGLEDILFNAAKARLKATKEIVDKNTSYRDELVAIYKNGDTAALQSKIEKDFNNCRSDPNRNNSHPVQRDGVQNTLLCYAAPLAPFGSSIFKGFIVAKRNGKEVIVGRILGMEKDGKNIDYWAPAPTFQLTQGALNAEGGIPSQLISPANLFVLSDVKPDDWEKVVKAGLEKAGFSDIRADTRIL